MHPRILFLSLSLLMLFSCKGQDPDNAYVVIGVNSYNFQHMIDPATTISIGGNLMLNNKIALGLATSLPLARRDASRYKPYYADFSYFLKDGTKALMIADLQAGYADFKSERLVGYSPGSTIVQSTKGGFYISPGFGYYFRVTEYLAPYIKLAFVSSSFMVKETTTTFNRQYYETVTRNRYSQIGGVLSIGCKLL